MSTNNGVAPRRVIDETVEKNVNGVVMTASPGPTPSAISANSKRVAAGSNADGVFTAEKRRHLGFELVDRRAEDELLGFSDCVDGARALARESRRIERAGRRWESCRTGIRHWFWLRGSVPSRRFRRLRKAVDPGRD